MTTYALKYRPASFCTLPRGLRWEYVRAPHTGLNGPMRDLPKDERYPHGVFKTDRPLTPAELYDYEIAVVELAEVHSHTKPAPYPAFCRHPQKCAGLSCCPRDPNCCD